MNFEEKIRMLIAAKPGKEKQELLNKFTFGDAEFTSRYYLDAMTLEKYMEVNRERFRPVADEAARLRVQMRNKGWTEKKYQKYIGILPEPLKNERPEFASYLTKKVYDDNVRKFFKRYPAFRVDE